MEQGTIGRRPPSLTSALLCGFRCSQEGTRLKFSWTRDDRRTLARGAEAHARKLLPGGRGGGRQGGGGAGDTHRCGVGLADTARHVIQRTLPPRLLSQLAPYGGESTGTL